MDEHVALYVRLSPRPDGSYEGVDLQEAAGRRYAASNWPGRPVVVYADTGLSASGNGPRPRYEALREQIRGGRVAHLWTVEQTRLERTETGWFALAAELDAAAILEVHTDRDGVVRVGDDVAGIKAVIAAGEIRRLRRRVSDRLDANAAAGTPPGSTPFGFRHTAAENGVKTYAIVTEQAEVVRDAAAKVLSGWSLTSIVRRLVDAGVRGSRGGHLTTTAVRAMVTTPAVAGLRVHQGRIVGRGNWPPILDEATWRAGCDRLGAARTVTTSGGRAYPVAGPGQRRVARRYLLTGGLARCAVCGAELVGTLKQFRRGRRVAYYVCSMKPKHGGRGCVGIQAEPCERHVLTELMAALATPEFVAALTTDQHADRRDEITTSLEDLQRKRRDLAAQWARELTVAEWQSARDELDAQENLLRVELAEIPAPLGDVDPRALTDPRVWAGMLLDERREMVRLFVPRVTVGRATPPFVRVDLSRVRIDWRTA
jgi:DNA invertase Pin-like site-specific DNA recombinase